jgi:hypothetical protein
MMEQWNTGTMQFRVNDKICVNEEIKDGEYPFKNQFSSIPLFHYSIFEASVQASKNIIFLHIVT